MNTQTASTHVSKEKLVADLKVVVADAEELLRATASQAGEKVSAARERIQASLATAKVKLTDAARTLLSFVLLTRTRLAATELEEQGVRLIEILIWLATVLFFLGIPIVFAAVLVVLVFWDSNRLLAAGLLAALFVSFGTGAALIARRRLRERPKLLAATLAELERDRDTLGQP